MIRFFLALLLVCLTGISATFAALPLTPPLGRGSVPVNGLFFRYFENITTMTNAGCTDPVNSIVQNFDPQGGWNFLKPKCIRLDSFIAQYLMDNGFISFSAGNTTIGTASHLVSLTINGSLHVTQKVTTASTIDADPNDTLVTKDFVNTKLYPFTHVPNCTGETQALHWNGTGFSCDSVIDINGDTTVPPPVYTYMWGTVVWGACDKLCGGGTKNGTVSCIRSDGVIVPDANCSASAKPSLTSSCNTQACTPYTITYDANGGTPTSTKIIPVGDPLGTLQDPPNYFGYIFDGWYTTPTIGGEKVTMNTVPYSNTTYYARWIIHTIKSRQLITSLYDKYPASVSDSCPPGYESYGYDGAAHILSCRKWSTVDSDHPTGVLVGLTAVYPAYTNTTPCPSGYVSYAWDGSAKIMYCSRWTTVGAGITENVVVDIATMWPATATTDCPQGYGAAIYNGNAHILTCTKHEQISW